VLIVVSALEEEIDDVEEEVSGPVGVLRVGAGSHNDAIVRSLLRVIHEK